MKDDELVEGFEAGTLAAEAFRHREHVRLTWIYLGRHGRAEAERRLLDGLRAFAARAGRPDKFDAALTRAWVEAIDQARAGVPAGSDFEALVAARPDLLDRTQPAARVTL